MIIRDVLFALGCAAGVLLATSQYIIMFWNECRRDVISSGSPARLLRANRQADRERHQGAWHSRPALGAAMVKETKFFRKQAKKAERMARAISDAEAAESLSNLAEAYRKQADVLKAKRKSSKKRR